MSEERENIPIRFLNEVINAFKQVNPNSVPMNELHTIMQQFQNSNFSLYDLTLALKKGKKGASAINLSEDSFHVLRLILKEAIMTGFREELSQETQEKPPISNLNQIPNSSPRQIDNIDIPLSSSSASNLSFFPRYDNVNHKEVTNVKPPYPYRVVGFHSPYFVPPGIQQAPISNQQQLNTNPNLGINPQNFT